METVDTFCAGVLDGDSYIKSEMTNSSDKKICRLGLLNIVLHSMSFRNSAILQTLTIRLRIEG